MTFNSAIGQSLEVVYNGKMSWDIPKLNQSLAQRDSKIREIVIDKILRAQEAVFVYKLTYVDGQSLFERLRTEGLEEPSGIKSSTFKDMNKRVAYRTGGTIPEGQVAIQDLNKLKWDYVKDTIVVLGYPCVAATSVSGGMELKAWYAPDIPIMDGPLVYTGLPGLIMKLVVGEHTNTYEAVSIKMLKKGEATIQMPTLDKVIDFEEHAKSSRWWKDN